MNNYFKKMNVKQKLYRSVVHILVIAWMIVIFCFSAQPGDESADLSGGISHMFMSVVNFLFGFGWDDATLLEMTYVWDYPIRKLAHMTEFGILALLVYGALNFYERYKVGKKHYIAAWVFAVLYACTDEVHQLFVQGRSGNLLDVGVDSIGALLALLFLYIVQSVYIKFRKR